MASLRDVPNVQTLRADDKGPAQVALVPLVDLTQPRDGEVITNHWWTVHEGRAVLYRAGRRFPGWSPQCNRSEIVARRLQERCWPGAETVFVPTAYLGQFDLSEYV